MVQGSFMKRPPGIEAERRTHAPAMACLAIVFQGRVRPGKRPRVDVGASPGTYREQEISSRQGDGCHDDPVTPPQQGIWLFVVVQLNPLRPGFPGLGPSHGYQYLSAVQIWTIKRTDSPTERPTWTGSHPCR